MLVFRISLGICWWLLSSLMDIPLFAVINIWSFLAPVEEDKYIRCTFRIRFGPDFDPPKKRKPEPK